MDIEMLITDPFEQVDIMRLWRITHTRCQEWDGNSYVLAPKAWARKVVQEKIGIAEKKYKEAFEDAVKFLEAERPGVGVYVSSTPNYNDYPSTMTVAEIQKEHAKRLEEYKVWSERKRKLQKTFEDFLYAEGFFGLHDDIVPEEEVYWGHAHGKAYEYGQTNKGGYFLDDSGEEPSSTVLGHAMEVTQQNNGEDHDTN